MKNKKSLLSLALIVLVLVLGVGYAVVSSVDLTISGTAKVKDSTLKVSFEGTTATAGKGTTTASATDGTTTATIAVTGLEAVGDVATATYTIQNEETDLDANVELKVNGISNNKEEYFEVTTSADTTATKVSANGTATVTVSVKLIKMPIVEADSTATIGITLTASPAAKSTTT